MPKFDHGHIHKFSANHLQSVSIMNAVSGRDLKVEYDAGQKDNFEH